MSDIKNLKNMISEEAQRYYIDEKTIQASHPCEDCGAHVPDGEGFYIGFGDRVCQQCAAEKVF